MILQKQSKIEIFDISFPTYTHIKSIAAMRCFFCYLLCLCTRSNKSNAVSNTEIINTNHHGIQKNKSVTISKFARYAISKIMIIYILIPFYKFLPSFYRSESWNIQSFLQLFYKNLCCIQLLESSVPCRKD